MKRLRAILALTMVVTMALSGCGPRKALPPTIVSGTVKPVALIAQAIAGTALQVHVLAGDDGAPLQNAQELASASAVVFQTGTSIDTWSSKMQQGSTRFVSLSASLDKGTLGSPWLSFRDATDMALIMRDTLDALYPDLKEQFDSRYAVFMDECSQADGRLKRLVWSAGTRTFLAEDTTWSGAAADFGLQILVQPGLKGLDLSGTEAASSVADWGSVGNTRVVVVNIATGGTVGVIRHENGIVACSLDALGATAESGFVPWLEGELTLLGSAIGK
ncbi:MAG: zinc ABC transporter substrate-binding protein [Caldiserica bacterium]|nr:zinc ABC transporter substrate-binding protein [Caldisericota bacterium]